MKKQKKVNKEKTSWLKKDIVIQPLRDRLAYLETLVDENSTELNKKHNEVHDLQFKVDYNQRDLTLLNSEIYLTRDHLQQAEIDKRNLSSQIAQAKHAQ